MERIKQMSLKKSFFCLTMLFLLIAIILSVVSMLVINQLLSQYGSPMEIEFNENAPTPPQIITTDNNIYPFWYQALNVLQFLIPVFFIIVGLLLADFIFYRIKLKKPLSELQFGAERIMQNDLNFSIYPLSNDELGQLCGAFEAMRRELLKKNKELWHQMEERKRLNAAFSHDLRNPVTVLKGSAKILKKGIVNGGLSQQNKLDSLSLIEEYAGRIETYVEAMSSVQRLEELQCHPKKMDWKILTKELSDSIYLLTMDSGLDISIKVDDYRQSIWLDKSIAFNVTENLIANAIRYAKEQIQIYLVMDADEFILSVQDDGIGFSQDMLQKGSEPFLRGEEGKEQKDHFGMGLYVSRLLCEIHGGSLKLQNNAEGALTKAILNISIS